MTETAVTSGGVGAITSEDGMRMQLALNVNNLEESIDFYSKMFNTQPAKVKPGYANFAIENPPLKLVLFEAPGAGGTLNHVGVEVANAQQVEDAERRMAGEGMTTTGLDDTLCCYAAKTETWVEGPDTKWEWYVKTDDAGGAENVILSSENGNTCCPGSSPVDATASAPAAGTTPGTSNGGCC